MTLDANANAENPQRRELFRGAALGAACMLSSPLLARADVHAGGGAVQSRFASPIVSSGLSKERKLALMRTLMLAVVGQVPVIGGVLSGLGAAIIPVPGQSPQQMWRAYTDRRISETVFKLVEADLLGLTAIVEEYRSVVQNGSMLAMGSKSIALNTTFLRSMPRYQLRGYERELLPLFAVAASLHLALLRDMGLFPEQIGLQPEDGRRFRALLTQRITEYTRYVDDQVGAAVDRMRLNNPYDWTKSVRRPEEQNKPLTQMLEEKAKLQIDVLDLRDTWYALDADLYPRQVKVWLDREVFSPVLGYLDRRGLQPDRLPVWTPPLTPLCAIGARVNGSLLYGIACRYWDGSTIKTGMNTDSYQAEIRWGEFFYGVKANLAGYALGNMEVTSTSRDGSACPLRKTTIGRVRSGLRGTGIGYDDHVLSSIRQVGTHSTYSANMSRHGSTGGLIAGFQLKELYEPKRLDPGVLEGVAPRLRSWLGS